MKDVFKTIEVHGHIHVVKEVNRNGTVLDSNSEERIPLLQPNYRGTNMALCGVLKPGQTLEGFQAWLKLKKEGYKK